MEEWKGSSPAHTLGLTQPQGSGHTKPGIMDLQRAECSQVGSFEGVASKVVIFQRIFVSQEHGSVPAH